MHVTDRIKHAKRARGVWHFAPRKIFDFRDRIWCRFGVKQPELDDELPNLVEAFKRSHNLKAWLRFALQRQQSGRKAREKFF